MIYQQVKINGTNKKGVERMEQWSKRERERQIQDLKNDD